MTVMHLRGKGTAGNQFQPDGSKTGVQRFRSSERLAIKKLASEACRVGPVGLGGKGNVLSKSPWQSEPVQSRLVDSIDLCGCEHVSIHHHYGGTILSL